MPGRREYTYEAMFLISQATAADLGSAVDHIKEILSRGHAEVLAMRKWDDRRLAYEIDGQKRGLYILTYFKAPNDQLSHIERDCNLSEKVLRVLILRADHLSLEEIQAADARKELDAEIRLRGTQPVPAAGAAPAEAGAAGEPAPANA
ncbi:MAG: 30S ribosomal protein S6 [Phycisphaerales bacterium]|nr:30S ribosomal protein S6 [Phycisphaerales bacterium]